MNHPRILFSAALLLNLATLVTAIHAEDTLLKSATYCRTLEENQSAKDKADSFYPDEKIRLSIELKGRPKSGIAAAKFFFREQLVAEAKVDVAVVNKGVLFSAGQNTFVGFTLSPTSPLPVGATYRADVTFEGAALGSFPFEISPPKDSVPNKINSVTLARSLDDKSNPVDETREFTSSQKVFAAGRADLGNGSWIEVNWLVAGKVDSAGTKSFTMRENKKDVPFYFSFLPKGGWPEGAHQVVVVINGKEAAKEKFTVKVDPNMKLDKPTVAKVSLFHDDGKGEAGEAAQTFGTDEKILHVQFKFTAPALVQGGRVIWTMVESELAKNTEIISAAVKEEEPQKALTSFMSVKKGLPAGKYRVQLMMGEDQLAAQDFDVKAESKNESAILKGLKSLKQD